MPKTRGLYDTNDGRVMVTCKRCGSKRFRAIFATKAEAFAWWRAHCETKTHGIPTSETVRLAEQAANAIHSPR